MEEWGPYTYREVNGLTDVKYHNQLDIPLQPGVKKDGLYGNFYQNVSFYEPWKDKMDEGLDQPIYQINQAA